MKYFFTISLIITSLTVLSQRKDRYIDSLESFRINYIQTHEVVKENDREFLRFFPIDGYYAIECNFEKTADNKWFQMNTSGKEKQVYRRYGKLSFTIHDTTLH